MHCLSYATSWHQRLIHYYTLDPPHPPPPPLPPSIASYRSRASCDRLIMPAVSPAGESELGAPPDLAVMRGREGGRVWRLWGPSGGRFPLGTASAPHHRRIVGAPTGPGHSDPAAPTAAELGLGAPTGLATARGVAKRGRGRLRGAGRPRLVPATIKASASSRQAARALAAVLLPPADPPCSQR